MYIEHNQQVAKQRMISELDWVHSTKLYFGSPVIKSAEEEMVVLVTLEAAGVAVMEMCPLGLVGQEEEQTDVSEVVESILIPDVHKVLGFLPGMIVTMPRSMLLMWVVCCNWDARIPQLVFHIWDVWIPQLVFCT